MSGDATTPPRASQDPAPNGRGHPLRKRRVGFGKLTRAEGPSREARQLAAVILEVLGGARTPVQAAAAVGVSPPRYYALEARAVEGLLHACERRPRGPRRTAERECARLGRELQRATRECARTQALLRAQERVVGLVPRAQAKEEKGKGKRRKRRAVARALRAAAAISAAGGPNALETRGGKEDDQGARKG